jgi:spermidine synthase
VTTLAVYALFFLSGISGLIYQVVWVRQFGNIFGNTVYSAATVSAVFLCGLGVGSYCVGRWIDTRYRMDRRAPLRAYGGFELGIAALGLLIALTLPGLEALSATLSAYQRTSEGWYELTAFSYACRYGAALLLLTPITFLMGGTLTLLIRHLVHRDLSVAGWRIGALYGINTAGAALGAFLTDFALIPGLGIRSTELVAVGLNTLAGSGAWWLARRGAPPSTTLHPAQPAHGVCDAPLAPAESRRLSYTAAALFLSGAAAMGLEILWFRYLSGVIGSYRSVFSLLLTVILSGIWLGSTLGGFVHRRVGRPVVLFLLVQTLFVVVTLGELAWFDPEAFGRSVAELGARYGAASPVGRAWLASWVNLRTVLAVVGAPALLMGFAFPLANANVQRLESAVGHRAGLLYLWNTLGNVSGSLLAGFLLLPWLGIQGSVAVLAGVTATSLVSLYLAARDEHAARENRGLLRPVFAAAMLTLALALGCWGLLPADHLLAPSVPRNFAPGQRVLAVSEGVNEVVAVLEAPGRERALYTNGHPMSSTHLGAQRYMRLFAHLPLLQLEAPRRVLVVCFGVGNTLHAASLYPSVERLDAVDLSKNVVRHVRYFAASNGNVAEDPRVSIFINDGRQHLRMQPERTYDLITLEPPPISHAGVASLYSREFYALARSRLTSGGFMTQWLPAYQVSGDVVLSIILAFREVFPNAILLSGFQRELILMGQNGGPLELDLAALDERIRRNGRVHADLRRIEVESLTALVGTFVAGSATLERATRQAAPVTDDHPVMEYSVLADLFETRLPGEIFDVSEVESWCPDCFEDGRPLPEVEHLPGHLAALAAYYASHRFRHFKSQGFSDTGHERSLDDGDRGVQAAIRESAYLQRFLLDPKALLELGRAFAKRGELERALVALRHAVNREPRNAGYHTELAHLYLELMRPKQAAVHFQEALRLEPDFAPARSGMTMAYRSLARAGASP